MNNNTYYISNDEVISANNKYNSDLYQSFVDNNATVDSMSSFVTDSVGTLMGDTWDAIRADLSTYIDQANILTDLNRLINETQNSCFSEIEMFLAPDDDLNTADLPKFEEEKIRLETEINQLKNDNDAQALVSPTRIEKVKDVDDKGNVIFTEIEVPNEPEYSNAQNKIRENNDRIQNVLQPDLDETNRLIEKINEFKNDILPKIEKKLDAIQEQVSRFVKTIDALDTSNVEIYKRYFSIALDPDIDRLAKFYFDESGKPYAVDYLYDHIHIDYTDPDNPKYSRYNPETHELLPISIFDIENTMSLQYGANQNDFNDFDYLIEDPLIWNEMQKYFPVEDFDSLDQAMEFYEKYFDVIADNGCGYVAAANLVFQKFEGKEKEFEETFGYPMYTVNERGVLDFNYERFVLGHFDYSIAVHRGMNDSEEIISYLDIMDKIDQLSNNFQKSYNDYEQLQWEKQYTRMLDLFENKYDNFYFAAGTTDDDIKIGNLDLYLKTFGIDINYQYVDGIVPNASNVIVASGGFTLEYPEYEIYDENIDLHYMYVTDYDESGRQFVSSWGNRYVLDTKDSFYNSTAFIDFVK